MEEKASEGITYMQGDHNMGDHDQNDVTYVQCDHNMGDRDQHDVTYKQCDHNMGDRDQHDVQAADRLYEQTPDKQGDHQAADREHDDQVATDMQLYYDQRVDKHYDHGFAWIVAFCAFMLSSVIAINIISFGVLLTEFADHYQLPYAYLSILAAVRTGFTYLTGNVYRHFFLLVLKR